jgi:pimeloyl-ACP methyl ester carboxylesterase
MSSHETGGDRSGSMDPPIRLWPAPLAPLGGAVPPAPAWFDAAIAIEPERSFVDVLGVPIETLAWGERGKPGLILLHGNGAHADWWSFIAPFFAADYRVVALSWSGMGRSGRRTTYDFDTFVAELFTVGEAAGAFDAGAPFVVGHSFGGFLMMAAVAKAGERFKAAVIVDTPFSSLDDPDRHRPPERSGKPHRPSATLAEALARFKLAPPQGCENLYIADFIARRSLVQVPEGWIWAFDPMTFGRLEVGDSFELLQAPRCPVALMWGSKSMLMPPTRVASIRAVLPAGSPAIEIPDAEHHVMIDQPLGVVAGLRGLFAGWPG